VHVLVVVFSFTYFILLLFSKISFHKTTLKYFNVLLLSFAIMDVTDATNEIKTVDPVVNSEVVAKTVKAPRKSNSISQRALMEFASKVYKTFVNNLSEPDVLSLMVKKAVAQVGAEVSEFNSQINHSKKRGSSDTFNTGGGEDGEGTKKKKHKKAAKHPDAPKNPLNGFLRYQLDPEVKDGIYAKYEHTSDPVKNHLDYTKRSGQLWSAMGTDEKRPWEEPAKAERAEYKEKMKSWVEPAAADVSIQDKDPSANALAIINGTTATTEESKTSPKVVKPKRGGGRKKKEESQPQQAAETTITANSENVAAVVVPVVDVVVLTQDPVVVSPVLNDVPALPSKAKSKTTVPRKNAAATKKGQ
jgi:hypothetical protein